MSGVLPNRELVTLATFAIKAVTTNAPAGRNAGAPTTLTPAVAVVIRADDGNAATINWGMGNAGDPLAAGETVSIDLPQGYFMDLSQLVISGTSGDQIHVTAAVVQSVPGA